MMLSKREEKETGRVSLYGTAGHLTREYSVTTGGWIVKMMYSDFRHDRGWHFVTVASRGGAIERVSRRY